MCNTHEHLVDTSCFLFLVCCFTAANARLITWLGRLKLVDCVDFSDSAALRRLKRHITRSFRVVHYLRIILMMYVFHINIRNSLTILRF